MKNKKKIIVYIVLITCLITSIILVNKIVKNKVVEEEKQFDLLEIVDDVNLATNSNFMEDEFFINDLLEIEDDQISDFGFENNEEQEEIIEETTNYVMAVENTLNEYFLIIKEPSKKQKEKFDRIVKKEGKNIKTGKYTKYIYLIKSKEFTSTIEGIIRSYIY